MLSGSILSDFGRCDIRIDSKKAQPPEQSRGRIARTYIYMEFTYPKYKMSKQQRQLMMHGTSNTQCQTKPSKRIEQFQGNANPVVNTRFKS